MANSLYQDLMLRIGTLRIERESFIAHWRELSEFVTPRRGRFMTSDRNDGSIRNTRIINGKATRAHTVMRAGLLSGVASPSRPWFHLRTPDPAMMEFQPVRVWLQQVEEVLRNVFNGSNFYNMAPTLLGELGLFGTGAMLDVDDFDDIARFYTQTVGSYMLGLDDKLRVNTLAREFEMTTSQMVQKFGLERVSSAVKTAYDNGNYDAWWKVYHVIEPNPDRDYGSPMSVDKRFRSVYFENCEKKSGYQPDSMLQVAGFDDFPAYCPRWETTGEDIYGTNCPGMVALGDVKQLQMQEKRKAQGIDKMVNPPLHGPAALKNVPVSSLPGGLTVYDGGERNQLAPIYMVNPQLQELRLDMQSVESRIDEAFMVDMFLAITSMEGIQPRNQFELQERNQERLLQIGPALEQLHSEFLSPAINRNFDKLVKLSLPMWQGRSMRGPLPPPPQELEGQLLQIAFVSTLAQAQRAVATGAIDRLAAYVGGLVKAGLSDGLKFDGDQSIDEYSSLMGAPARLIVPDEVVEQRRAAAQQQQAMAAQAQLAEMAAGAMKDASQAQVGDQNALEALGGAVARRNR